MLHKVLGLPEFLLGSRIDVPKRGHSSQLSQGYNKSIQQELGRRDSSPSSASNGLYSISLGAQSSQDFLRAGSSTKSMRLMNTFLDVLRVFTQHKFICLCLDDLQFADDESLDLITQIVAARMRLVLIVTYRPGEILPEKIRPILEPPNSEGYIKAGGVGVTRIELQPLAETDITEYVAMALCRSMQDIVPLAAVIQSKTAGNPFYMREMLDTCHRKQCIWYDYQESMWRYDLDRIFKQFETESYHDTLNHEFVTSRLSELPSSSRTILAWASLVGTSFSFELIQRLLSGEFDYDEQRKSPPEAVEGLQAAIQAYIIVPTQDDDQFRFAHDRYLQAASSLAECDAPKMHFIIAQTLLKYYTDDDQSRDMTATHISEAIELIKQRVIARRPFRLLLFECAQAAAESGARSTAARFYTSCFELLQRDSWSDASEDCYYDETLQLYTRASECYLYMGQYDEAGRLLRTIFSHARTPVDEAPAWVLQSRVYSQEGNSGAAFKALKRCINALNIQVDDHPTFEKCDAEFERLSLKIQSLDRQEIVNRDMAKDSNLAAVGAVLVETISAAFWTDRLVFYQMSLVMVNTHLSHGAFPQAGMAFLHLATIAIARFNMVKFASDMGNISLELMDRWRDPYTMGRGNTIYSIFVGHVQFPLAAAVGQLEGALEYAISAGDRISTVLNFGFVSFLKFSASDHLVDLESFCTYGCEEVIGWQSDTRGGTMLIAVRQLCRALQGKTFTTVASDVMADPDFNYSNYKSWLETSLTNSDRPLLIFQSLEMAPLFLYGHFEEAIKIGESCLGRLDIIWTMRNTRFIMLFQGLSLVARLWGNVFDPRWAAHVVKSPASEKSLPDLLSHNENLDKEKAQVLRDLRTFQKEIEKWQVVTNVNYLAWSKLLAAQIAEIEDNHSLALSFFEESLDHASVHSFVFEEALGNFLLAGFFLRQGARRPAKAALRESIMLYKQMGAVGVAKYMESEHSLLLQGATQNLRTADASAQTDFAGDSAPVHYQTLEGDEDDDRHVTRASISETKGDRIDAWQGGAARPDAGSGLPALDMLDLTSILESSQVISSVLQIDQLLKTMCEIILQNCGGLADLAVIIVEEEDPAGWSIAASGDPDKGAEAHIPGIPLGETSLIAEGVIVYCTRFRETVFLPNIIHDERFSNVDEAWSARNPGGKSIIAVPIAHGTNPLLGVLYLEGKPNILTDRNLTVLQLLVASIGTAYSNALTMKAIEKISASNISMVDLQKRALSKAIEAEAKAKAAEAEALRSVQLAEEAAKAKSIFLANVSHELRTPLNGVIGNSELLKDSELRKDQAEMADSIRVSADLLLTVINDILDFSKMEADKMKLFIVAFNANEMVKEVVRSVSYSNRDKNSSKNVAIIEDISLTNSLIYGDPVRIHQVLGNLIGNSLKFTDEGSITIGAKTVSETSDTVQLTFWVKDTGIGIPSHKLVKLFKPFSQADASTARKYGGSGLGLSICRSLIESMMGGRIELESIENVGTTAWFTVTFPKAHSEVLAGDSRTDLDHENLSVDQNQALADPLNTSVDFSNLPREQIRICVAEDNPINQKIAIQFMQKLGFKYVDAYVNGLEAVQGIRARSKEGRDKRYHICLMDVQMPVMDGYEATKLLRKDPDEAVRNILVIAMTASAIQGDREKCLDAGMNDYLAKPVRSGVLKKKLDQYISQPPLVIPSLRADASHIAHNAMKEINGTVTPFSESDSGATTPMLPLQQRSPNFGQAPKHFTPPLERVDTVVRADITEDELSPTSVPRMYMDSGDTRDPGGTENEQTLKDGRSNSVVKVNDRSITQASAAGSSSSRGLSKRRSKDRTKEKSK
ncbi:hsp90-like protein [Phlyctema vagabunda]|uniref:histidine kinase n=1 Tax=Phlyctema vagabunda TaxID=108571 RepID=A0ABR4PYJ3_9HELO